MINCWQAALTPFGGVQRHVHGDAFERLGVDLKWMNTECKRLIRTMFINPPPRVTVTDPEKDMVRCLSPNQLVAEFLQGNHHNCSSSLKKPQQDQGTPHCFGFKLHCWGARFSCSLQFLGFETRLDISCGTNLAEQTPRRLGTTANCCCFIQAWSELSSLGKLMLLCFN